MLTLIFFYLVLPFVLSAFVIRFLKKHGGTNVPREVRELCAEHPIERRCFRALRIRGKFGEPDLELTRLGDFEKQIDAVDAMYQVRAADTKSGAPSSYIVLNDKGDILEEI